MRCNVMQCHAMQSDRETQNHYATRLDTTHFACSFGITSHCNAIILNVFLHIVFDTFLDRFWYQKPPQNLPKWGPNLGVPGLIFGFCDPWPPKPAQDGVKMAQMTPQMPPRWPNVVHMTPKRSPRRPKIAQMTPKMTPTRPRVTHMTPKMPPRHPQ